MANTKIKNLRWENVRVAMENDQVVYLEGCSYPINSFVNTLTTVEYDYQTDSFNERVSGYEVAELPDETKLAALKMSLEAWFEVANFISQKVNSNVFAFA